MMLLASAAALTVAELWLRSTRASSIYAEIRRRPPNPFLQITLLRSDDHVNAQGFRGDDVEIAKPPRTVRIFTIGGSTTMGITNSYPDSYPFLLQQILQERHPDAKIEVQNAGTPWYTSGHALVSYIVRVRQYEPDLVIFFEAINDLVRSFSPPWLASGDFRDDYSHYLGPLARLLGPTSAIVDPPSSLLTWNLLVNWLRGNPDPFDGRHPENVANVASRMEATDSPNYRSLPSFRRFSASIIHSVQSDGHAIMTASQPSLYREDLGADERRLLWFGPLLAADHGRYPSLKALVRGMELYNGAARDVAAEAGVPFIDFAGVVPKTIEYFVDDVHMKKEGNALVARAAADAIEASGLIDRVLSGR
jgi:lysophospholipase L1-like esterase